MAALGFGLSAVFIKAAMSSVSVKTATAVSYTHLRAHETLR